MEMMKCVIIDIGDPSVGISPQYWEVECPFTFENSTERVRSIYRATMQEVFHLALCKENPKRTNVDIHVEFDFEKSKKINKKV